MTSACSGMTTADVIATASLAVALLALGATGWQGWLTRRHGKLSVRPLLTWHTLRVRNDHSFEVIFTLANKGIGPAIVRERYFTRDGHNFMSPDPTSSTVDALVAELLAPNWQCHIKAQGLPGVDTAVVPGEPLVIAHLIFPPEVATEPQKLSELLDRVSFVVVYEDLYQEKIVFRSQ